MRDLFDLRDAHIYGGLALVAGGAGWVYPPAALMVFGIGLIGVAVVAGRRRLED